KGGTTALADWEAIALKGRRVLLAFDSDVSLKPEVRIALERLAAFLSSRGAVVRVIYLPASDDGGKVGLDDYLAAGHTVDDLLALATELRRAPDRSPLPQIIVSGRPLRDRSDDAIAALRRANNPTTVFVRGGRIVRIRDVERCRTAIELL